MPYDPSYPATGIKLKSAEMRTQFTGLKELIDAVPPGTPGEQGPPGEVTAAQLAAAIAGTARNPTSVGPWTGGFSDPPTVGELQDFAAWVESVRLAVTR